jgi:hypothetical protein
MSVLPQVLSGSDDRVPAGILESKVLDYFFLLNDGHLFLVSLYYRLRPIVFRVGHSCAHDAGCQWRLRIIT